MAGKNSVPILKKVGKNTVPKFGTSFFPLEFFSDGSFYLRNGVCTLYGVWSCLKPGCLMTLIYTVYGVWCLSPTRDWDGEGNFFDAFWKVLCQKGGICSNTMRTNCTSGKRPHGKAKYPHGVLSQNVRANFDSCMGQAAGVGVRIAFVKVLP